MADETKKMAASPLHDAAAEEEESKSSSAMFVTPALEDEGEPEKTADELAAAALLEAKDDVQEGPAEKPAAPAEEPKPDAPFNVFGIANTKEAGLQVKEEPQGSDEEPEALVLNDLRKCEKCQ